MLWKDICARIGMPEDVSFNIIPPGTRAVSCYYIEEFLSDWGGESVYSLEPGEYDTDPAEMEDYESTDATTTDDA